MVINGNAGKWARQPGGQIIQPNKQLELPFKPFTLAEVHDITKVPPRLIDDWSKRIGLRHGCGVSGLDYMQAFAVFVGYKYALEGAPPERSIGVVVYLSGMQLETLEKQLAKGNVIPIPNSMSTTEIPGRGMMVPMPEGNSLAKRLNTATFLAEFKENVQRVFSNG